MAHDAFCALAGRLLQLKAKNPLLNGSVATSIMYTSRYILKLKEECIAIVETECKLEVIVVMGGLVRWTRPKHLKVLCMPFKDMSDFD